MVFLQDIPTVGIRTKSKDQKGLEPDKNFSNSYRMQCQHGGQSFLNFSNYHKKIKLKHNI